MDFYMLVLRLIHIADGVFWAGSGLFFAAYLTPAAADAGEAGGRVMGALIKRGVSVAITIAAGLTMLSGILMYWRDSAGFSNQFMFTGPGVMFTIGGIAGLAAGVIGGGVVGTAISRMGKLGAEIAQSGGKPSTEQAAEMGSLSQRLDRFGKINAILLAIAVLCMGTAQYVTF